MRKLSKRRRPSSASVGGAQAQAQAQAAARASNDTASMPRPASTAPSHQSQAYSVSQQNQQPLPSNVLLDTSLMPEPPALPPIFIPKANGQQAPPQQIRTPSALSSRSQNQQQQQRSMTPSQQQQQLRSVTPSQQQYRSTTPSQQQHPHPPPPPPASPPPVSPVSRRTSTERRRSSFSFLRRSKSTQSVAQPDKQPNDSSQAAAAAAAASANTATTPNSATPLSPTPSIGRMSRKQKQRFKEEEARRAREAAAVPKQPPQIPQPAPLPAINTFGGYDNGNYATTTSIDRGGSIDVVSPHNDGPQAPSRQSTYTADSRQGYYRGTSATPNMNIPIPPIPSTTPSEEQARADSMTHRSRYSYASTFNSPRRVRRRKDPTPFNILVIGARNSGKTSFINFLVKSLSVPAPKRPQTPSNGRPGNDSLQIGSPFMAHYLEAERDGERLGITIWDSQGLEKNIVDLQLREISAFLESKFEETFAEETKVVRAPGVRDTHIHCVFMILDPARLDATVSDARLSMVNSPHQASKAPSKVHSGLDEKIDMQALRALHGKTIVIPVISKADTITAPHMTYLKRTVWDSLKRAKLDPLEALSLNQEESDGAHDLDEEDEDDDQESTRVTSALASNGVDVFHDASDQTPGTFYDSDTNIDAPNSAIATSPPRIGKASPQLGGTPASKASTRHASHGLGHSHKRSVSSISASLLATTQGDADVPFLPLSIISPDIYDTAAGPPGRRFPWGFADPYNPQHCDFVQLKDSVFNNWRGELREVGRQWYEAWRTSRLKKRSVALAAGGAARQQRIVSAGTDAARPPPASNTRQQIGLASTAAVPIQAPSPDPSGSRFGSSRGRDSPAVVQPMKFATVR